MERTYAQAQGTAVPGNSPPLTTRNPILNNPDFCKLVHQRRTFAWSLTAVMLVVYFGFILALAFKPKAIGTPINEGLPMTWGIPLGFGMLAFTTLLVAVYVWRANACYDQRIKAIIEDAQP
ncbi:DUF485 domain-containing protein [Pseudomonas sp. efr-133-TYG-103a]|uniref:DUF485 domain-containing protein n=1 Tax=Pseudomonas sp. efr-133-TYG-103a TaxID=3040308 RepID=UPI0025577F7D|nr:DUF485 domain-containing protein [Pseudomonas sp. efr-133-TYG-103a]